MPYHLDTDICVAAMRGVVSIQERIRQHVGDLYVSTVVLGELFCGALRSQRVDRNLKTLEAFIAGVEVVPLDASAARTYGEVCAELLRMGRPTGEKDALIGAIARHHAATLVTHNTRHFQHIADLTIEDWLT